MEEEQAGRRGREPASCAGPETFSAADAARGKAPGAEREEEAEDSDPGIDSPVAPAQNISNSKGGDLCLGEIEQDQWEWDR